MTKLTASLYTLLAASAVVLVAALAVGLSTPSNPSPESVIADMPLSASIVVSDGLTCDGTPIRGGCFSTRTPSTIYISPNLSPSELTYVVLHEYAHLTQHHLGQPLSDCQADSFAMLHGANISHSRYTCDTPTEQELASITLTR